MVGEGQWWLDLNIQPFLPLIYIQNIITHPNFSSNDYKLPKAKFHTLEIRVSLIYPVIFRVCQRDYKTIESTEYDRNCKQDYETKCDTIYR